MRLAVAIAVGLLFGGPIRQSTAEGQAAATVPFGVGERLEYEIRYGIFHGSADMEITSLDTVRGREAWHATFNIHGGVPFFRVNDRYETWIDVHRITSLRYKQDIHDGSYERQRLYEFLPELKKVIDRKDTLDTVDRPVDDASILYFLRTISLSVGRDTAFNNYFLPDRNPVRIRVLRRDTIKVAGATYPAVVIQPLIKTKGIFSEGGEAEVWLSDDNRHIILQMKSKVPHFPLGHLSLYLKSYRPPTSRP